MVIEIKTQQTLDIEKKLYENTIERGIYGAFEVTFDRERVDFLTVNRKGIWKAYEIKVTKEDFHSKAAKTFVGNYNYYVMPEWLYNEVKDEIPDHIGVIDGKWTLKKAKKVELGLPVTELYINLVCALNREANKYYNNLNDDKIAEYKRRIVRLDRDKELYYKKYKTWCNKYYELLDKMEGNEPLFKN